jgi:hypothetical protein
VSVAILCIQGALVIQRPSALGTFEFVVLAALRASQLMRGCLPKVDGAHTIAVTAQLEIAQGKVPPLPSAVSAAAAPDASLLGADDR